MEMTFGKAHDIWSRVVSSDNSLTEDEVKAAAQWFDDFTDILSDKASLSKQELEDAIKVQKEDVIEKKTASADSDKRQLDDFIRKYDALISWLNSHK